MDKFTAGRTPRPVSALSIDDAILGVVDLPPVESSGYLIVELADRSAADIFIDNLGDSMRTQSSAVDAIISAFEMVGRRGYTSLQLYLAGEKDCLLFAGKNVPRGMTPGKTKLPLTHPVLEQLIVQGKPVEYSAGDSLSLFQGGIVGYPFHRSSPVLGRAVVGAFIATYNPDQKVVDLEESRVLERVTGFLSDRMLQLREWSVVLARERVIEDLRLRNMETGLYNNTVLWRDLGTYLDTAKNGRERPYLLLFDVDDMKGLNDKAGHLAGDQFIAEVGKYLQGIPALGKYRAVADKFALLFEEKGMVDVVERAKAIRLGISGLPIQQDIVSPRTVSMGLVQAEPHFDTVQEWYVLADDALSKAKQSTNCGFQYVPSAAEKSVQAIKF